MYDLRTEALLPPFFLRSEVGKTPPYAGSSEYHGYTYFFLNDKIAYFWK